MSNITLYIKDYCPYCKRAKALLVDKLGQDATIIDIQEQPEKRDEMIAKANGRTTVPQIFINDEHIGGCDDLMMLHSSGKLEEKLK